MKRLLGIALLVTAGCGTEPDALLVSVDNVVFAGFGVAPAPRNLTLSSTGAALSWAASADAPWLTIAPQTGTTPSSVVLIARPDSLGGGTAATTLRFSVNGSADVPVTVRMDVPGLQATWTGTVSGAGMSMTLVEAAGVVTGTGAFIGMAIVPFTVTGTHRHPLVNLTLSDPCCATANFDGIFLSEKTVIGVLTNTGFSDPSVTLVRP